MVLLKNTNLSAADKEVLNEALFGKSRERRVKAERALEQVSEAVRFLSLQKDNLTVEYTDIFTKAVRNYGGAELTKIIGQLQEGRVPLNFINNQLPLISDFDSVISEILTAETSKEAKVALDKVENFMTIADKATNVKFPIKNDTLLYNWENWYLTVDRFTKLVNTVKNTNGELGTTKMIVTAILVDGYFKPYMVYLINAFISIIKAYRMSALGKKENNLNEDIVKPNYLDSIGERIARDEVIDRLTMDVRFLIRDAKKSIDRTNQEKAQSALLKELDYPIMTKYIKEKTGFNKLDNKKEWEIVVSKFYKDILSKQPKAIYYYLQGDTYCEKLSLYADKVCQEVDGVNILELKGRIKAIKNNQEKWLNEVLLPYLETYGVARLFKDQINREPDEINIYFLDMLNSL